MAASTSASIFIKGVDQTGKAIKGAVANLSQITKAANNASKTLRNVFELGTTVAVLKKVVKLSKEYFNNVSDPKVVSSMEKLKKTANEIKTAFSGAFTDRIATGLEKVNTWFENAKPDIENVINAVLGIIENFPKAVGLTTEMLAKSITTLLDWKNLQPIISTLFTELTAMVQNLFSVASLYAAYFVTALEESFNETGLGKFISWVGGDKKGISYGQNQNAAFKDLNAFMNGAYDSNNSEMAKVQKKTAKELLKEASDAVTQMVTDFGTGVVSVGSTIKNALDPVMQEYMDSLEALNSGALFSWSNNNGTNKKTDTNFINKFANTLSEKLASTGKFSSEQASSAVSTVLNNFTSSLGKAGTVANELATNMASMGPVLGAIVTALKYVFEGIGEVLVDILDDFVEYGLEPLREFGRMIGGFIKPVLEELMPLVRDSADFAIRLFKMIGVVLKPIIEIISSALTPIISSLSHVFEAITPVLKVFAKVLVTITGTFQYIVQVLQHWVASVMNWLASIKIFGSHPFKNLAMTDPGSPGSYGSFIKNKWSEIDAAFEASASDGIASGTSVSSASYQGATNVTINIYQEAPVVGDPGMRQFAQMIRNEFEKLDYYGVTA